MASLFRTRQPFLQLNAWQNAAQNGLHYNTSVQGSVVTLVYGTTRVQSNLLDFQGYRGPTGSKGKTGSLPVGGTQSRSAKGGGGKSGKKSKPDYTVNVAFGIAQGPISGVGNVYTSAGQADISALPLTLATGADGQPANSTFVGFGSIVGYSGTAVVYGTPLDLGPSPVLPNIGVEVFGFLAGTDVGSYTLDANPADVIKDFLTNSRYGAQFPPANLADLTTFTGNSYAEYCQAAPLLISVALDGHQKAIEWLDAVAKLTNSAMVFRGKLLHFIPYGDLELNNNGVDWVPNLVPEYALDDRHFLPWRQQELGREPHPGEDDPILVTRTNAADADNWMSIEYTDRGNFYNSTTLTVNDQGSVDTYGLRIGDSLPGRMFTNPNMAQISAQLALQRKVHIRNTPYRHQLGWQYARLTPMDIITLTGRYADIYLQNQPVRILSIEEDDQGGLTIEAEEIQTGTPAPPLVIIPPVLDGLGYGDIAVIGDMSLITQVPLTTSHANDIIIAFVIASQDVPVNPVPASPQVLSLSTPSLPFGDWTLLGSRYQFMPAVGAFGRGPVYTDFEIWWAPTTAALSSEALTINFNEPVSAGAAMLFGVSGVRSLVSPFDVTFATNSNNTMVSNIPTISGITTTNPGDLILAIIAAYQVPPAGYPAVPWSIAPAGGGNYQPFIPRRLSFSLYQYPAQVTLSGATFDSNSSPIIAWQGVAFALKG